MQERDKGNKERPVKKPRRARRDDDEGSMWHSTNAMEDIEEGGGGARHPFKDIEDGEALHPFGDIKDREHSPPFQEIAVIDSPTPTHRRMQPPLSQTPASGLFRTPLPQHGIASPRPAAPSPMPMGPPATSHRSALSKGVSPAGASPRRDVSVENFERLRAVPPYQRTTRKLSFNK
jgi:hypothetical protein